MEHTSTVILGATKPEQVLDNLKALEVIPKLTLDVLAKIDEIVGNKPAPWVRTASNSSACWVEGLTKGWRYWQPTYGRMTLDPLSKLSVL